MLEQRPSRNSQIPPNPIIDTLYSLCGELERALKIRDKEGADQLWDAVQTYYLAHQRSCKRDSDLLPWPEEMDYPQHQMDATDIIGKQQIRMFMAPIKKAIEDRWKKTRLDLV